MSQDDLLKRVEANPLFHELKAKRNRLGWTLAVVVVGVFYSYLLVLAFNKDLFAMRLGDGVIILGIPVGIGIILLCVVLTAWYVRRANTEFDELTRKIVEETEQ